MPEEDNRCQTKVLDRARPAEANSSNSGCNYVRPPTSEGHNFFVRAPILVFLDSMESPLSQEYIYMLKEDIRYQTEVIYRARLGQVSSANSGFDYI